MPDERTARPLRIAHLTATFPPYHGGTGTTALHLARGAAAHGHQVDVFTAPASGEAPEMGAAKLHRIEPLLAIGNAPLIPRIARLSGYDVLHVHYPFIFGTELALAARLRSRGTAIVVSYQNRLIGEGRRRPMFWVYEEGWGRALTRSAERVCVLSEAHAGTVTHLRELRARRPERLEVLPNGVDVEAFSPPAGGVRGEAEAGIREQHGIGPDAVVAAFVAALDRAHYFKRLDLAIDALSLAGREHMHLLVVGGGELLEQNREQAARAGVADRVHFAGPAGHGRLPALLRASDLLLMSSDPPESFGIVLIEAMACGLPALTTDFPGVRAVVRDGETGIVVPRGDAPALASAMGALVALGPDGRREMGFAGRAECERRFAWPRLVERIEAIYADAVELRRERVQRRP